PAVSVAVAAKGMYWLMKSRPRSRWARNSSACQGSRGRSSAPSSPSDIAYILPPLLAELLHDVGQPLIGAAALGRLDADARQTGVQPAGQPPVGAAEEVHEGGDEQGAQDEGVQGDGGGEGDAEHGDHAVAAEHEGEEDRDHDDRGGVDHAAGL